MQKKEKALLIISPGFPLNETETDTLAPVQMFIKALIDANSGLKIYLIATQYPFEKKNYLWNGVNVHCLNGRNKKHFNKLITWRKALKTFHQIQQNNQIEGILSLWLGECFLIGERMAKKAKCKHYNWVLGQDGKPENPWLKWLRPRNNQLIAISKNIQSKLENRLNLQVRYIPGGFYSKAYSLKENPSKSFDFINVGSLIQLKNQSEFISILHQLKTEGYDFKACIIGDGPLRSHLETKIIELGLSECIQIKGQLRHEEALDHILQSRCLIHTSHYEGHSTVISEALYCGSWVLSYPQHLDGQHPNLTVCNNSKEITQKAKEILKIKKNGCFGIEHPNMANSANEFLKLFIE